MANSKNLFTGLIKITGNHWTEYESAKQNGAGKLIFADITTAEHVGKYFYANGIEYKVADATNLDELIQRVENMSLSIDDLSTFVRETVNASVADLSTRLIDISTYVHTNVDASISRIDSSVIELDEKIQALEGALEFRGEVASAEALTTILSSGSNGDVYVATSTFNYGTEQNVKKIETGDLVVLSADASTGTPSTFIIVERNLDGAVTSGDTLTENYIILGNGNQSVKVSEIALDALTAAVTNANSAIQSVTADSSTTNFVDVHVTNNASTYNVQVGAKTATLADASNGLDGIATASDVYTELIKVEETIAATEAAMATILGLEDNFDVSWGNSGIANGTTYKQAIIDAYRNGGVTSFGNKVGQISVDGSGDANHNVIFIMDGSTLKGNVDLSDVDASISRIDSSNVAQDASIIDHQSRIVSLEGATYVRTVTGESGIAQRPNDEYVAVSATTDSETGTVTLNASVQLAEAVTLSTGHTAATVTGLATDGMVKDYVEESLMWEVITD